MTERYTHLDPAYLHGEMDGTCQRVWDSRCSSLVSASFGRDADVAGGVDHLG